MSEGQQGLTQRFQQAARDHGVLIRPAGPYEEPSSIYQAVKNLRNMEYEAECVETGETAEGNSMKEAWANLRNIPESEVHDRFARWDNANR